MIDLKKLAESFTTFKTASPFSYCVVDDFFTDNIAQRLEEEFLAYDSDKWMCYNNLLENKKSVEQWTLFPKLTYSVFQYLNSPVFVDYLASLAGYHLYSDSGLHGGGWHCHGTGGNLNPHLDYSIHPKLGLQRKLNIIIYVSSQLKEHHGGHLGFWEHDPVSNQPSNLIEEIEPKFNRAVIFDTTQNSWHGMSRPLLVEPNTIYRKSLAIYYLCEPPPGTESRGRALFAPRENQRDDANIEQLIKMRSNVETSNLVYRK